MNYEPFFGLDGDKSVINITGTYLLGIMNIVKPYKYFYNGIITPIYIILSRYFHFILFDLWHWVVRKTY